jgi:hypothetical protein
MIKYWAPMFYAGEGYNYANECMELLHNLIHDWPKDTATILRNGMLVNTTGDPRKFKETDIRVEQFNKTIKSHTSGANARPVDTPEAVLAQAMLWMTPKQVMIVTMTSVTTLLTTSRDLLE